MKLSKRILKHPRTQSALSWLLSLYIRFVYHTNIKIRRVHPDALPYMEGKQNGIFAFWHGRMMLLPKFEPPGHKMHVLISFHRDGMLISQVIGHFGEATISGSSSKGGAVAIKEMLRALKRGDNISITPDGPRGPLQEAAPGIAIVARMSKKAVIPVTFYASRHVRFKSWDRFMLALPFGRIVFFVGAPILVEDETEGRLVIEQAMNQLVEQADGFLV